MTPRQNPPPASGLEVAAAVHLAVLLVGVAWAFGGNADWVRTPISIWGSAGILLSLLAFLLPPARSRVPRGALTWTLPVLALNAIVAGSCLTPGFRQVLGGSEARVMPVRLDWWVPSAANAGVALRSLWLFDGIYFSCLNVALAVRRRHVIRLLLAAAVANAVALSIFGTVQKLVGSTGIYFGSVPSPQVHFFASFVYDNHWGAYIVLMTSACIGLVLRYSRGSRGGGFFRGPAVAGLVAILLMGLTVPLSGSRACTLLLGAAACVAALKGARTFRHAVRSSGVRPAGAAAGAAVAVVLVAAGVWAIAGDVIGARASKTREQVAAMWASGGIGSRSILYHDTLRMARDRPLFGWGMGSFPSVFRLYNSQESRQDRLPVIYHDAHSDWLQSLAELGVAGTALIAAAVLLPLAAVRRRRASPVPFFLLTGCALVAAYAWIEFPFGNVAVVLAWWCCLFCAVQYIRLSDAPAEGSPEG